MIIRAHSVHTETIPLPKDADRLRIRLKRWAEPTTLKVRMAVLVNGQVVDSVEGGTTGGRGLDYGLTREVPRTLDDAAREFMRTAKKDARGFVSNVPLARPTDSGTAVMRVELENVSGSDIETEFTSQVITASQPTVRAKNSVAFNSASSATEDGGDGVLSVNHTAAGSDRAVVVGVFAFDTAGDGVVSASCTYGGIAMTEELNGYPGGGLARSFALYSLAAPATGSQSVVSTMAEACNEHTVHVISFTGVNQSDVLGAVSTANGATAAPSLSPTGVDADGMVVDFLGVDNYGATITAGANQTQRTSQQGQFIGLETRSSTQAGADGAAMTWTINSSSQCTHVAVAVNPADAGDVTPPTLSNPAAFATGTTTGSGSVDTDEGNGTLYWVVTESSTAPSAAQVQAGQDHTGAAAVDSGSQAVSGTGTQNVSGGFSGLTASTTYYAHYCHVDAASNESDVATSASFTTDAEGSSPPAMLNESPLLNSRAFNSPLLG